MKQFITLGLFVLLSLSSARALLPCENAEGVCDGNQAVAIDCQDTKNAIVIRDTCVSDKWTKSCEAQGVYSIWGLMEVGTDDNITKTTPAVHKCKLAKGN